MSETATTTDVAPPPPTDEPAPKTLEEQVVDAIKTCYDPEIPVNIYDLGLIYSIDVAPDATVAIKMTLTAPACPAAGSLPGEVLAKAKSVPGVVDATVDLVWEPPWTMERMTKLARVMLGM